MSLLLLLVSFADAKPKKSKGPPPPPPVGWYKEEAWTGECYAPPDFEKMGEGDRKIARQQALEAMTSQWRGQKGEDVLFSDTLVEDLETVLLGRPAQIEGVARANQEACVAFRKGGSVDDWQGMLRGLPAKLTAGECPNPPLTYQVFDYLNLGQSWQRPIGVCEGDKVQIIATVKDKYRISDDGPWINVEGDPAAPAPTGSEWPCNLEGCKVGQLVGKFTSVNGVEVIFPIGAEKTFVAPAHGTVTYSINDTVWYDNRFFKGKTIEDRTAITIQPGEE